MLPPIDRPWQPYTVFLAGDSAKIGSCDLRKSTATSTNLKLIVSRNFCIYEHSKTSVAAMTTNSEAKADRSYQAQRLRESFDVHLLTIR